MEIKLIKVVKDEKRGRVYFEVLVDGKKKNWNVAKGLFIVFSGDMPNLIFVEVETLDGKSINFGEWLPKDKEGFSYLQIPTHSPAASVPSKEKILEVLMESEFYKNIIKYKEARSFTKEIKNLVNDLHALLTEKK
jgi:hypothetical protein